MTNPCDLSFRQRTRDRGKMAGRGDRLQAGSVVRPAQEVGLGENGQKQGAPAGRWRDALTRRAW